MSRPRTYQSTSYVITRYSHAENEWLSLRTNSTLCAMCSEPTSSVCVTVQASSALHQTNKNAAYAIAWIMRAKAKAHHQPAEVVRDMPINPHSEWHGFVLDKCELIVSNPQQPNARTNKRKHLDLVNFGPQKQERENEIMQISIKMSNHLYVIQLELNTFVVQ